MVDGGLVTTASGLATTIGIPATIVIIILGMVLWFLKGKKSNNDTGALCTLSAERADQIMHKIEDVENISRETNEIVGKTFDMHNVKDSDGVYNWYTPRSWSETQKDVVTILHNISKSQEIIAATLERMERKSDNN